MQNLQCASENIEFSMQSTPTTEVESSISAAEETDEDLWSVWPYCWAINLYDECADRFHSLHQKLSERRLARINKRNKEQFQAKYWQSWNRDSEGEEFELRLV